MTARPIFLHTHPVNALADELLGLLEQKETELRPTVADETSLARLEGAKTVIDAVCDVIDGHLINRGPAKTADTDGRAR